MSGSQYIALSGLRARVDELDRLASDIANVGTAGYKGERESRIAAERPSFSDALQTAIDTTSGTRRLDMRAGAMATTGRSLDMAIQGEGFFVVQAPGGDRYTRNGHFTRDAENRLTTEEGYPVMGTSGPITLGEGEIHVDQDGVVWAGTSQAGQLRVVTVDDPGAMGLDGGTLLNARGQAVRSVDAPSIRGGTLEQSNVSVAERLAALTTVTRSFEALQKSISLLMNDVDGRVIDQFGRR